MCLLLVFKFDVGLRVEFEVGEFVLLSVVVMLMIDIVVSGEKLKVIYKGM